MLMRENVICCRLMVLAWKEASHMHRYRFHTRTNCTSKPSRRTVSLAALKRWRQSRSVCA